MKIIKWGIRGTGYIANRFADGMAEAEGASLVAVCSRTLDSAKKFADRHRAKQVFTDYRAFLAEADIDVLYLATPNDLHYEEIIQALEAGIPVLSEKPIVDNAWQLEAVRAKAAEKDLFWMEGMWTRFFPATQKLAEWLREGRIGEIVTVKADFSYPMDPDKDQPWKAGISNHAGSLRDVGIYSLALADLAFPQLPNRLEYSVSLNGEVDDRIQLFLDYGDGKVAFLSSAFTHEGSSRAEIIGTKGQIFLGPEFWHPTSVTLVSNSKVLEEFTDPYPATGFQYEIEEVGHCLRQGLKESPYYDWQATERIAELIESTRKRFGLVYPSDRD